MNKIKTIIVDDHSVFRKGMIAQLNEIENIEVIGEAENGKKFLELIKNKKPDLVFMDIKMPEMNGIDTTAKAKEYDENIKIVALSMFGEEEYLQSMLDAGANGFLLKNIEKDDIEKAIANVMKGNNYFSEELINTLTSLFVSGGKESDKKVDHELTEREKEVLELICKGYTNSEIADKLYVSRRTIDGHRANIISKVGAKNTVALVTYAIKHKMVEL